MNVSAASLAPDSSLRKATPSDITERTARSGAVAETIFCQDHGVHSVRGSRFSCRIIACEDAVFVHNDFGAVGLPAVLPHPFGHLEESCSCAANPLADLGIQGKAVSHCSAKAGKLVNHVQTVIVVDGDGRRFAGTLAEHVCFLQVDGQLKILTGVR